MENFEDDDDTHFCNKCHRTINGLENYVRHRQSGCRTDEEDKAEVFHCPSATPAVSYPEILNADAFFSSLELQSSSKTHSRRNNDLLDGRLRKSTRNAERKRRLRKDKSPEDKEEPKEKLTSLLPVVSDLDDLALPSLVGFPDIVSTTATASKVTTSIAASSSKPSTSGISTSKIGSKHESTVSEQKHRDENQSMEHERHQPDWLDDTILADVDVDHENENKSIRDLDRFEEYDYQQDEESDDDSLEEEMVEEDSYTDSDDSDGNDQKYPPHSHTGGKWRPGSTAHEEGQINEDDADTEEPENQRDHPPPTYTGGKWKPPESAAQKCDEYESKDISGQPPPSHTRGKWVPGARADISTGYWCSPCGRKLASRLVYNRHLLSDLHARRSSQEIDGALYMSRSSAPPLLHRQNLSQRQKALASKKKEEPEEPARRQDQQQRQGKRLRRREKEVLSCELCHARVRRTQMGKHLLSHYHCRVAGANPSGPRARRFLLENMANIVRQCPFQCASCRFYCNTGDTFLRHWRSDAHKDTVSKIEGSFVCALCDFWCDDNENVEAHIMKQGHQDVVSMINGSVPIVIRRQRVLTCSTCCRRFRYNMQLRTHAKETGHAVDYSASDEYQRRLTCNVCDQILRSRIALQRHQLLCHKRSEKGEDRPEEDHPAPYFCSFCDMNFATALEAIQHRRSSSHKEKVTKYRSGETESSTRTCPHCNETQADLSEHKQHLLSKHSEFCHSCPKCGNRFALSQDVTRHTRENRCSAADKRAAVLVKSKEQWKCSECPFANDSEAEFLFHRALHGGPEKRATAEVKDKRSSRFKYRCPVCDKIFVKFILRDHLRSHTGERPFPCGKCPATFARRSTMKIHQRDCTGEGDLARKYICDHCQHAFRTKHTLRQHMQRHDGKQFKCGLPGCPTVFRNETEFRLHRKLVHEEAKAQFKCGECSFTSKCKSHIARHTKKYHVEDPKKNKEYRCKVKDCLFNTRTKSHLNRHMLVHTGERPYKCRHCTYAANNLENLRKHVLSSLIHPGKMIYICESCKDCTPYQTNFSKELRAHLLDSHPDEYPTPQDAKKYVANIFNVPWGSEWDKK